MKFFILVSFFIGISNAFSIDFKVKVETREFDISFEKDAFSYKDSLFKESLKIENCSKKVFSEIKNRILKAMKRGIESNKKNIATYSISIKKNEKFIIIDKNDRSFLSGISKRVLVLKKQVKSLCQK